MAVEIISIEYTDIENIELVLFKGNINRNPNPKLILHQERSIFWRWGLSWNYNFFWRILCLRDLRGQRLIIYPFQYNPVLKVLPVMFSINVKIYQYQHDDSRKLLQKKKIFSKEFSQIYLYYFINW